MLARLGFNSFTSYIWIHHLSLEPFPVMPYPTAFKRMQAYTEKITERYPTLPYYSNVTMGWDPSPRTVQSDRFEPTAYPFMGTLGDNASANFKQALIETKAWLEKRPPAQRILTINAWNEWTEGSYLEPDLRPGMGYLEAIREVFGRADAGEKD